MIFIPSVYAAEAFDGMDAIVEHSGTNLLRASAASAHTPAAGNWNHLSLKLTDFHKFPQDCAL
ncbi:hypothetical protein JK628_03950 [Shewanella sp. KX20019]|uniref:hypothetical protein n=1 Tax=Shewanella sp. KX20019 TaxID=2803864 RepID=UPI001928DECE|nr:hypothetical protein [Shewanella sp. KX20019]QQX81034.1 hypothetical protein JK628_03950 [Shewanella sp. KX20019]